MMPESWLSTKLDAIHGAPMGIPAHPPPPSFEHDVEVGLELFQRLVEVDLGDEDVCMVERRKVHERQLGERPADGAEDADAVAAGRCGDVEDTPSTREARLEGRRPGWVSE